VSDPTPPHRDRQGSFPGPSHASVTKPARRTATIQQGREVTGAPAAEYTQTTDLRPNPACAGSGRIATGLEAAHQFFLLALELGGALARRAQACGLPRRHALEDGFGFLPGHRFGLGGLAQARGFLGLDLRLDAQAFGFLARARGLAPAGLEQQVGALTLQPVDLAPRRF